MSSLRRSYLRAQDRKPVTRIDENGNRRSRRAKKKKNAK